MSEKSEVERAIRLYFEAINSNDASIAPFARDVVKSGPMLPQPIIGEAAVRSYLDETAPFMARMDHKESIVEGGNAAVVVEFEGLNGVIIEGVELFRVKDGLICSDQAYFDTRPLFKGAN